MERKNDQKRQRRQRRRSLSYRMLWTTVISCIILGVTAILIGLGFYRHALDDQYIRHAFDIAVFAHQSATRGSADTVGLAEQVMAIYRGLTEEQRAGTGTEAYRSLFASVKTERGSAYHILINMLDTFIKSGEVDDVYVAMYDQETSALVYMADPQESNQFMPGEWETVGADEIQKFLEWDGTGRLYHNSDTEKYGWLCTAGVPIRNESGEICAFLLVDLTTNAIREELVAFALRISLALLAVTALIAHFLLWYIRRNVVRPLNALAGAAASYVRDRKSGAAEADHFSVLNIHSGTEMENLSLTMADMERDLAEHEETVKRVTAEKERINTELNLATQIQEDALPHVFPAFPEREEFDLYASMVPAREVGGDFYDFFLIDSDHLAIVIADVSGKGVPAALFMMVAKAILKNNAMSGVSPAKILTTVNETICSGNHSQMFITIWLGILEISTGRLTACNAGHEYPAISRNGGAFGLYKDRHSFVIGGMPGTRYRDYEITLQPGDRLFLYTDGVPEATDTRQELFGTDRMIDALNEYAGESPQVMLVRMKERIDAFVSGAEQFDDLTMLCVKYRGAVPRDPVH